MASPSSKPFTRFEFGFFQFTGNDLKCLFSLLLYFSQNECTDDDLYLNYLYIYMYSQTCLSDPLYTTSFVSRPYLFLPSVFPCIRPLYNDPLSNATNDPNDRVLWVKILHITTIRGLLSNRKLDNK